MSNNEKRFTVKKDTYERVNDDGKWEFGTEWVVWDNLLHTPDGWYDWRDEAEEEAVKANRRHEASTHA